MDDFADTKEAVHSFMKNDRAIASALCYGVCSAIVTMLALGGLFYGLFTSQTNVGTIIAGRSTILGGSLFGVILEVIQGSAPAPQGGEGLLALPLVLYVTVFLLAAAIACSLLFSVFALIKPKRARALLLANGWSVLTVYSALLICAFLYAGYERGAFSLSDLDLPALVCIVTVAFTLFFAAILQMQGQAAFRLLAFVCSYLALFSLLLPGTALSQSVNALLSGNTSAEISVKTALWAALLAAVCNAVLSVFRLAAGKNKLFDIVRFCIQSLTAISLVVTSLVSDGSAAIFTDQPLAMILFLSSVCAAFVFSAVAFYPAKQP